jgi:uncharacterized membrane protein HdeD (DUF308 family)
MKTATLVERWWAIALRGVAAIIFGVLTFALPGLRLAALIVLFSAYALVEGVFNIVAAARGGNGDVPGWALFLEGLVSIAAGIITVVLPGLSALALMFLIAGWAIVTGVLEIVAAIRLRRRITGEWRLAVSGVLSVAFGILTAIAPGAGALALVFGILLVALAFRLRRASAAMRPPWPVPPETRRDLSRARDPSPEEMRTFVIRPPHVAVPLLLDALRRRTVTCSGRSDTSAVRHSA